MDQNTDKPMYKGNWTCAGCGGTITQLPFQPNPERQNNLRCADCFKKAKQSSGGEGSSSGGESGGGKQMFEGNWTCAGCGAAITKLPFQPNPERENQLRCLTCYRAQK